MTQPYSTKYPVDNFIQKDRTVLSGVASRNWKYMSAASMDK